MTDWQDDCDKCKNLDLKRPRCVPCKTINLARVKEINTKPDMQIYNKCIQEQPCLPVQEMPCNPACIRVLDKEEYLKCICKQKVRPIIHPIGHGPFVYIIKAAIVAGTMLFTYKQGVWGNQREANECYLRWTEYARSLSTRRAPEFDKCGKVIVKESTETLWTPIYMMYKSVITTIFQGVVKFPTILKCMYLDYLEKMRALQMEKAKERGKKAA